MSFKCFCDLCKEEINTSSRIAIQVNDADKKTVFHYHNNCYKSHIKCILEGVTASKQSIEDTEDTKTLTSIPTVETPIVKKPNEPLKEKILTVDVDRDKFKEWELTKSKGITKYFTNAVTAKIHRYFLLKTPYRAISNMFHIPYQTVVFYHHEFDKTGLASYSPIIDKSTLEKIWSNYKNKIPKILALIGSASRTWTFDAIHYECDIPIEIVQMIWDELPYFVRLRDENEKEYIE